MKTATASITTDFDIETVDGHLPLLESGAVLTMRPVPAVDAFRDDTLRRAISLLDGTSWNVGVDQMATIRDLDTSLRADHRLIESGIRDDETVRARATAAVRGLSAIFTKADAHGLVAYDRNVDPAPLACPDFFEHMSI